MTSESPVLDTLADMTAASVDHNSLSPRDYMLVRLAALIAMDAPPISYFVNAAAIEESGITTDEIQGVMIAVAPVVGAPRVMSAGGHILRALGIAVAVADADMAAEVSQPQQLSKLGELVEGKYRIASQPPVIVSARDLAATFGPSPDRVIPMLHDQFRAYRDTLQPDRRRLLEKFQIVDAARKVVGVGSVGTRAGILHHDP